MDMPSYFYEAMANVLASGTIYKLYYPNYQIFTGQNLHLINPELLDFQYLQNH
jgi:hypothetical protein